MTSCISKANLLGLAHLQIRCEQPWQLLMEQVETVSIFFVSCTWGCLKITLYNAIQVILDIGVSPN